MTMPRSVMNTTVEGNGYNRQEGDFDQFGTTTVSQNRANGKTPQNTVIQDPKERLLALTPPQQRVTRAVRRYPKSDSVAIANATNSQRHASLAHSKKLADELGVLDSDKDDPKRGGPGSKKPLHFWLADDIPGELVDAVLGDSEADPDVILAKHNRKSKTKSDTKVQEDLSPLVKFAGLPPPVKEIAIAIAQAGNRGIGAPALSEVTGQRTNRIYGRADIVVAANFVVKQPVPGFKKQSVFIATPTLLEVIEQLPHEQTENVQANSDSNDETSEETPTMQSKAPSSRPSETESDQSSEEISQVWEVLKVVAKRLKTLESRFTRVEASLQGKERVSANEILEMLNSDDL